MGNLKIDDFNIIKKAYRGYHRWRKTRGKHLAKAKLRLSISKEFYSQFIKPGNLCFDVGANVGVRSEAFLELGAKVVAVEPQSSCIDILKRKFKDTPQFTLIGKALSNKEGQDEFFVSNVSTVSTMSKEWIEFANREKAYGKAKWEEKVVVETTSLDKLIAEYGVPDFCKIDVEGFELTVLQGLTQPIKLVSIEYALKMIQPTIDCIEYLRKLGTISLNYSEGETMVLAMQDWIGPDEMIKLLREPDESALLGGDVYIKFVK